MREIKKIIYILFVFGFLLGIFYINLFTGTWIHSVELFSEYFKEYCYSERNIIAYIWYIVKIRILPIILILIPAKINLKRILIVIIIIWTGFLSGLIFTVAVLELGIKGIVLCIVGIIPHFICYVTAYIVLFVYLFTYPDTKWNEIKTISIILFLLLGIITEVYLNPVLLTIYMKILQ